MSEFRTTFATLPWNAESRLKMVSGWLLTGLTVGIERYDDRLTAELIVACASYERVKYQPARTEIPGASSCCTLAAQSQAYSRLRLGSGTAATADPNSGL